MILMTREKKEQYIERMEDSARKQSQWRDVFRRLFRNKLSVVGLIIVLLIVLAVVFAPLLTRYDYGKQDPGNRLAFPSFQHLCGTDNFGRDIFSRLLYGGRISLLVSLMAVALSMGVGVILGSLAGLFGGTVEVIIMRFMDIIMAVPQLLLMIALSSALGDGLLNTAVACSFGGLPSATRLLRATVLTIRDQEFVEAAIATGSTKMRLIFRHIIPNTIAPLIVDTTLRIGGTIMAISGLSFVGLGVQPPTPEWGSILSSSLNYIRDFYPLVLFPGLLMMLTLFGFSVFGDGLRDALDPKMKD
ncbi:MAG: ABC transporter permease [Oscillospiraceae bacterium]|jgi:peptide/nickel transport system permease protein|nr:ABC transporter permease [Oscillospiraceae bacterium]